MAMTIAVSHKFRLPAIRAPLYDGVRLSLLLMRMVACSDRPMIQKIGYMRPYRAVKDSCLQKPYFYAHVQRIISAILGLLVLLLSCLPCDDAAAITHTPTTVITAQQPAAHNDGCTNDACSPFCACSCCAGVVLPVPLLRLSPPAIVYFQSPFPAHCVSSLPEVFFPVWQPPKLV